MQKSKTTNERATHYFASIKRGLQVEIIDKLKNERDTIIDKLYSLSDFSLDTDQNKGILSISKEECQRRFKESIELEYKLRLLDLEIAVKEESFNKYFGDGEEQYSTEQRTAQSE